MSFIYELNLVSSTDLWIRRYHLNNNCHHLSRDASDNIGTFILTALSDKRLSRLGSLKKPLEALVAMKTYRFNSQSVRNFFEITARNQIK